VHGVPGVGGVLAWLVNTAASAVVGFVVGAVIATIVGWLPFGKAEPSGGGEAPTAAHGG